MTTASSKSLVRGGIPLSALATAARWQISVSPARSVRPIAIVVKESDGTAWRVITVTVAGRAHYYGDPPYPVCPGNRWIDLEVECPHDHPPTEAAPVRLSGVVVCEASILPVCAADTERDHQWAADFQKPRGAHELSNNKWQATFRGDASPSRSTSAPEESMWITEVRCRTCDGVMQSCGDHTADCSNCFGKFTHTQPSLRPCDRASSESDHGSVIYVPRLAPRQHGAVTSRAGA